MKVKIKRIDKSLPLPEYQTAGAVAFDLYARATTEIEPHTVGLIPTNVVIQTPVGYMLTVVARSSTPRKKGLSVPHGIGLIAQDYSGETDEIMLQVYNFTESRVTVERGERVGQAVFVKIDKAEWQEVDQMDGKSRGGFGSTG